MSQLTPHFVVINPAGRKFYVRLVRKGVAFSGEEHERVWDGDEPLVEFFDGTFRGKAEPSSLGYFTGTRCRVDELFRAPFPAGISFHDDPAVWHISGDNVREIRGWLWDVLSDQEKEGIQYYADSAEQQRTSGGKTWEELMRENSARLAQERLVADAYWARERERARIEQLLAGLLKVLDRSEAEEARRSGKDARVRRRLVGAKNEVLQALEALEAERSSPQEQSDKWIADGFGEPENTGEDAA